MNESLNLALALVTGVLLGIIFFGGLWWTVRKGLSSQSQWSAFLFPVSLLLRTGIALTGFYLVADGRWERLLACLLGFVAARLLVVRLTKTTQDVNHAPYA